MDAQIPSHPTFCDRHFGEKFTGFCAACLRERLVDIENAGVADPPRWSTAFAIKSTFVRSTSSTVAVGRPTSANKPLWSSFQGLDLRRCKSFSASPGFAVVATAEPKRKSSDVCVRKTLWSLFSPSISLEDEARGNDDEEEFMGEKKSPSSETKTMRNHIDFKYEKKKRLGKDLKEIAGSSWLSSTFFSQKLCNWTRRQKFKKKTPSANFSQPFCGQSDIAVNAFGFLSCDADPRSSFDDHRYVCDERRTSGDGHLLRCRSVHPRLASDIKRFDCEVTAEDLTPGGTSETWDYYNIHRRSLDRSTSTWKSSLETGGQPGDSFNSGFGVPPSKQLPLKKSRHWGIWGFIHRRNTSRLVANVL